MRTIRFGQGDAQFQQTNSTEDKVVTGEWINVTPKKLKVLSSTRKEALELQRIKRRLCLDGLFS